jgi:monofunctional biosynthetic peptidoglycan transglycosylase
MICRVVLELCLFASQLAPTPVEFTAHANYFERNDSGLKGAVSYLVIENRKAFDQVFGVAATMRAKLELVPNDAFDSKVVVAVIKRGGEFWEYHVDNVTEQGGVLTVRYTAKSEDGKGARFASPMIVSVPNGTFREAVFVEGGKEVGRAVRKPQAGEARVLFDFARAGEVPAWEAVNDGVMGGVSDGRYKLNDRGTMEFFGTLSLENNGGFASVRSRRSKLGLKSDDTLLIRLRGDGREYLLNLYVPTLRIAYAYRASMPTKAGEWIECRIPIKDCYATSFGEKIANAGPVDASKINSIGFMVSDKKAGPFQMEIAWIKVVGK